MCSGITLELPRVGRQVPSIVTRTLLTGAGQTFTLAPTNHRFHWWFSSHFQPCPCSCMCGQTKSHGIASQERSEICFRQAVAFGGASSSAVDNVLLLDYLRCEWCAHRVTCATKWPSPRVCRRLVVCLHHHFWTLPDRHQVMSGHGCR